MRGLDQFQQISYGVLVSTYSDMSLIVAVSDYWVICENRKTNMNSAGEEFWKSRIRRFTEIQDYGGLLAAGTWPL